MKNTLIEYVAMGIIEGDLSIQESYMSAVDYLSNNEADYSTIPLNDIKKDVEKYILLWLHSDLCTWEDMSMDELKDFLRLFMSDEKKIEYQAKYYFDVKTFDNY